MKHNKEDYPILFDNGDRNFGLSIRSMNAIRQLAKKNELTDNKESVLQILKGKTPTDILKLRNVGRVVLNELTEWLKNNLST